jgi:uncharacterized surface protein with fasciclin (FAS1) repeats
MYRTQTKTAATWLLIFMALALGATYSAVAPAQDMNYRDQVQKMYIAYYGRPGDPAGVAFWEHQLTENGGNLDDIIDAFGTSEEYQDRFAGLETGALLNNIYVNILNRDADESGLSFYSEKLESGDLTLASIALDIANGIQDGSADAGVYSNKLAVANTFTLSVSPVNIPYDGTSIDEAVQLLAVVGADDESRNQALAAVDSYVEERLASLANIVDTAVDAEIFGTLVAALQATGLDEVLADESSNFTVFAPTDDAFALLGEDTINSLLADPDTLSDILLYHALAGQAVGASTAIGLAGNTVDTANGDGIALTLRDGALFVNNSQVVVTDIPARNGAIHVIDAVLLPPVVTVAEGTIVDVAVADGNFTTLVAALQATGLDAALADDSQTYTVFAPTDEAFAVLGEDTINALLADTDTLSDILLYHVIGGAAVDSITALSLTGTSVAMANGDEAALAVSEGKLRIASAEVLITDIVTENGIIHVIDAVILPPSQ